MKNVNLRSAAEKVLTRIKSMTNEELSLALVSCANGPINYAFSAFSMPTANPLHKDNNELIKLINETYNTQYEIR